MASVEELFANWKTPNSTSTSTAPAAPPRVEPVRLS
jgi:hypothetical protein